MLFHFHITRVAPFMVLQLETLKIHHFQGVKMSKYYPEVAIIYL